MRSVNDGGAEPGRRRSPGRAGENHAPAFVCEDIYIHKYMYVYT